MESRTKGAPHAGCDVCEVTRCDTPAHAAHTSGWNVALVLSLHACERPHPFDDRAIVTSRSLHIDAIEMINAPSFG